LKALSLLTGAHTSLSEIIFVSSTPGDSEIKHMFAIDEKTKVDFI
jgi:hypothetical protein